MKNKLKEYSPKNNLYKHIDTYWFFRNNTGNKIYFPVVPDGCSDIIFYLNDSKKLGDLKSTFVAGVMEHAQLISHPDKMELFGIRFKPSILFYLLKTDMSKLTNNMSELFQINNNVFNSLKINPYAEDKSIISNIEIQLKNLIKEINFKDNFFEIVKELIENPHTSIKELSVKYGFSLKNSKEFFIKELV